MQVARKSVVQNGATTQNIPKEILDLKKINSALGFINDKPDLYYLDSNLTIKKRSSETECNKQQIFDKIQVLFEKILSNRTFTSIDCSDWKTILENIRIFSSRNDLQHHSLVSRIFMSRVQNTVLCFDLEFRAEQIINKDSNDITGQDLLGANQILRGLHEEKRNVHEIISYNILKLLSDMSTLKLQELGGCLEEVNILDSFSKTKRQGKIIWENSTISSPEAASMCKILQRACDFGHPELEKALATYTKRASTLNEESKNILSIWQLYFLGTRLQAMRSVSFSNFMKDSTYTGSETTTKQETTLLSQDVLDLYKNDIGFRKSASFTLKDFDDSCSLIKEYSSKKELYDSIYDRLYQKALEGFIWNATNLRDTKNLWLFKCARCTPQEFSEINIPNIRAKDIELFFTDIVLKKMSQFIIKPQELLFKKITTKLLGIDENSGAYKKNSMRYIQFTSMRRKVNQQFIEKTCIILLSKFKTLAHAQIERFNQLIEESFKEKGSIVDLSKQLHELCQLMQDDTFDIQFVYTKLCDFGKALNEEIDMNIGNYCTAFLKYQSEKRQDVLTCENEENVGFIEGLMFRAKKPRTPRKSRAKKSETIFESELCDDFKKMQVLEGSPSTEKGKEKEVEEPRKVIYSKKFSPIPECSFISSRTIVCADRVFDWFQQEPQTLRQPSYKHLSEEAKRREKDFHSYPLIITRIAILRGIKSTWESDGTGKQNPHYSLIGQIHRYEDGKEETYNGIFTDCLDANTPNLLFHHHFTTRAFNTSLDDTSRGHAFQLPDELKAEKPRKGKKPPKTHNVFYNEDRFEITQEPGIVRVNDKQEKILYTVLLENAKT